MQEYKNFRFWSVVDAGHMAPLDQPETAHYIAKYIATGGAGVDKTPFVRAAEAGQKRKKQAASRRRRV